MTHLNPNQQAFRFCPGCGKPSLVPDSEKSFSCPDCGFLFFINNAAAAIGLIFDSENRLLLTRRAREPFQGTLDLPGGFADPGEGIQQTLVREIREELNLTVTGLSYLCSFSNQYPYRGVVYPVTDMAFICRVADLSRIRARDDVVGFEFLDPFTLDLAAIGLDSAREVVRFFREHRGPL